MATSRIVHYEVDGQLVTRDEIIKRTGLKQVTITYRLTKGLRTWAALGRPVEEAKRLGRKRMSNFTAKRNTP